MKTVAVNSNNYNRIHSWLRKNHKKRYCEFCKRTESLQFALKKGFDYEKDIKCFLILCASCHRKYDMTEDLKKNQSEKAKLRWKNLENRDKNRQKQLVRWSDPEEKKRQSERFKGEKNPMYGKKGEDNPIFKRTKEIVTCPYCKKQGGKPAMIRFHFDNCKFKII